MYEISESKEKLKNVELRLFRYGILKKRMQANKNDLEELRNRRRTYVPEDAKSLELKNRIKQLEAQIEIDAYEVTQIDRALQFIKNDEYYKAIECKYFDLLDDFEIADNILCCSRSTLYRQRRKLLNRLVLALYGMKYAAPYSGIELKA